VMTKEEAAEIRQASIEAEHEIWNERFAEIGREIADAEVGRFHNWLHLHEKRGWSSFWDELHACNGDKDCEERIKAVLASK